MSITEDQIKFFINKKNATINPKRHLYNMPGQEEDWYTLYEARGAGVTLSAFDDCKDCIVLTLGEKLEPWISDRVKAAYDDATSYKYLAEIGKYLIKFGYNNIDLVVLDGDCKGHIMTRFYPIDDDLAEVLPPVFAFSGYQFALYIHTTDEKLSIEKEVNKTV